MISTGETWSNLFCFRFVWDGEKFISDDKPVHTRKIKGDLSKIIFRRRLVHRPMRCCDLGKEYPT